MQISRLVKLSHPEIFSTDVPPDCSSELDCSWGRCKSSWNSLKNIDTTIDLCFDVPPPLKILTSVSR